MDIAEALIRMKDASGAKTQSALGECLGVSQGAISSAKSKGVIPPEWLVKLAEEKDINPNWIKFGTGPMKIGSGAAESAATPRTNHHKIAATIAGRSEGVGSGGVVDSALGNILKNLLAGQPETAQLVAALLHELDEGAAAKKQLAAIKQGRKVQLEEYDPTIPSGTRLIIEFLKSLDEFAAQIIISELQTRDEFIRWLEERRAESESKRA